MPLARGDQLAHYRIDDLIGRGGMGEVYRALDSKLDRDVAIKVLPEAFSRDAERVARFMREAKALASLNHPNIAAIYGLEEVEGMHFLVLELVEGETLSERLARGGMTIAEALAIARKVVEALEQAHDRGIVHRDLKPANIKVTPDDDVKVLDFGLAKALEGETAEVDSSLSPTITRQGTAVGVVLGTAGYMSPEQARGKRVDKRADIWAFGVVLYEMLSGKRLFEGDTVSDILARVLMSDIDLSALPSSTPPYVLVLLKRCLDRESKSRLRDIGEVRIALDREPDSEASGSETQEATQGASRVLALGALSLFMTAAALWGWLRPVPVSRPATSAARLKLNVPATGRYTSGENVELAVSRDGELAAIPVEVDGDTELYLIRLRDGTATPVPGTRGGGGPFFSPDGAWLGFSLFGELRKLAIDGTSGAVALGPSAQFGATWGDDETIITSPTYNDGLWRVSAAGGKREKLTEPDITTGELGHWFPQFLPDGEHVLFTSYFTPIEAARIEVLSLETGERRVLMEGGLFGRYVPSGHLVYRARDALMAVRFDLRRLAVQGLPAPIPGDVYATTDGEMPFSFADTGTLIYAATQTVSPDRRLVWVDRNGQVEPAHEQLRRYAHPRVSPDGRRIAVTVEDGISSDVWVLDTDSGALARVSYGEAADFAPNWSPDGRRLFYTSERDAVFRLYSRESAGAGEEQLVWGPAEDVNPTSVAPDGESILTRRRMREGNEVWLLPYGGSDEEAHALAKRATDGVFSPDGRWVAFTSPESGRAEVYVQPRSGESSRRQVSADGGDNPVWARDGSELYFLNGSTMMSVAVNATAGPSGRPRPLFEGEFTRARAVRNYDVAADGRFLMVQRIERAGPDQLDVVVNWFSELERLVP